MNEKASVTKELNAKHKRILEGLLKLPENRECADCKSKGPRWASVNLVFGDPQKSWSTHIKGPLCYPGYMASRAGCYIQSMGNEKSNSYWEADMPPNYNRNAIETFIRSKYEDKRWTPRDGKRRSTPKGCEEKVAQTHAERNGHGNSRNSESSREERKVVPRTKDNSPTRGISLPVPHKAPAQQLQHITEKEKVVAVTEVTKKDAPPKVEFSTNFFDMMSMDDPSENGKETTHSTVDNNNDDWAAFQSAGGKSTTEKNVVEKPVRSSSGIEDLFADSSSITPRSVPAEEKPKKDVNNDIMSLFEKGTPPASNSVSPFAMHQQQQMAILAQQQSLLMVAAKCANADPKVQQQQLAMLAQQQSHLMAVAAKSVGKEGSAQNWPTTAYQTTGMHNQHVDLATMQPGGIYPTSSYYTMGEAKPTSGTSKPESSTSLPYASSTQSAKDYDFSFLTEGMLSKR